MAEFKWLDAGVAAMAINDNIIKRLVARGVLTLEDREAILDGAIADLTSAGGDVATAADAIRAVFKRP
jgi:hypothetical protein